MSTKTLFAQLRWLTIIPFFFTAYAVHAGDIVGQVTDAASGRLLPSVTVQVVETGRTVVTDREGRYRIGNVPQGTYTVRARSVGYGDATQSVQVPTTGAVSANLRLGSDVVELGDFVVQGYQESRSMGLQTKRAATNIMDVISADSIGNLPDPNVADAIARLPGVGLSLEEGEGQFLSIRGAEPNLNQVLLDGATMAAPGGTRVGRAVPLDTISPSQISQIEVIKAVTPDMDGNAVGGTINLKTASAFDYPGPVAFGSLNFTHNEGRAKADLQGFDKQPAVNLGGDLRVSNMYGRDNQIGVSVTASYEERSHHNDQLQGGRWETEITLEDGSTMLFPDALEIVPNWGNRITFGVGANLEIRPDPETKLYFRPMYSNKRLWRWKDEYIIGLQPAHSTTVIEFTAPMVGTISPDRTRVERRAFSNRRDRDLFNLVAGGERRFGDLKLEGAVTYSFAQETRPVNHSFQFRGGRGDYGPVNFDWNEFVPAVFELPEDNDPTVYPLRRTREDGGKLEERTWTAKLDATWDFDGWIGDSGFLKTGFKYTNRDREVDLTSFRLERASGADWTLADVGEMLPGRSTFGGRFNTNFTMPWRDVWNFVRENPQQVDFIEDQSLENSIEDDYNIDEEIFALYGMGQVSFGPVTLLGGFRFERTESSIRASEFRIQDGDFIGVFPADGDWAYNTYLPNAQFVYDITDSLKLRAAATWTIGRPDYQDMRPFAEFEFDTLIDPIDPAFPFSGSIDIGNPELNPFDSRNLDLSLEYYAPRGSVLAVALFRKDVDDPIYTFRDERDFFTHAGINLEIANIAQVRNADKGSIEGVEFTVYQPFHFLPEPFNGFGIDANATFISSSINVPEREGDDLAFFRQPSELRNVTLYYERNRFTGRVAYNYISGELRDIGPNSLRDIYRHSRDQIDAQIRYRLTEQLSLTAAVRNLQRTPENFYYGSGPQHMRNSFRLVRDFRFGVSMNL